MALEGFDIRFVIEVSLMAIVAVGAAMLVLGIWFTRQDESAEPAKGS